MKFIVSLLVLIIISFSGYSQITACQCVDYETTWITKEYDTQEEALEKYKSLSEEHFAEEPEDDGSYTLETPTIWLAQIVYKPNEVEVDDNHWGTNIPEKWQVIYPTGKCNECRDIND